MVERVLASLCKRLHGVLEQAPSSDLEREIRTACGEVQVALMLLSSKAQIGQINRQTFDGLMDIAGPMAPELVAQLRRDLAVYADELRLSLIASDWTTIRSSTHTLMSLTGSVGAEILHTLCSVLNAAAHENDESAGNALGTLVLSGLEQLIAFISLCHDAQASSEIDMGSAG